MHSTALLCRGEYWGSTKHRLKVLQHKKLAKSVRESESNQSEREAALEEKVRFLEERIRVLEGRPARETTEASGHAAHDGKASTAAPEHVGPNEDYKVSNALHGNIEPALQNLKHLSPAETADEVTSLVYAKTLELTAQIRFRQGPKTPKRVIMELAELELRKWILDHKIVEKMYPDPSMEGAVRRQDVIAATKRRYQREFFVPEGSTEPNEQVDRALAEFLVGYDPTVVMKKLAALSHIVKEKVRVERIKKLEQAREERKSRNASTSKGGGMLKR